MRWSCIFASLNFQILKIIKYIITMKKLFKLGAFLMAFTFLATSVQAQKYGYVNFDAIVSSLPEMKSVQTQLETVQKQYQDRGKKMVEDLQASFQVAQQKMAEGTLSPKQQQEEEAKLAAKQEEIAQYEQTMVLEIQKKEFELLGPIREKMKTAIDEVAAEGSFQFIFNYPSAANLILFADDASNVTESVMKKLNITSLPTGGGK